MKKINKRLKTALIATCMTLIIGGTGLTYIVGDMVYKETVGYVDEKFQDSSLEKVYQDTPELISSLDDYETSDLMIPSPNGYEIEAKYIEASIESDKTVVLVHGIGMNMWRHLKEARMYLENDYNVLIYNQRYTGKTGGDNRSFGYYEKDDVAAVVGYLRELYPDYIIGAHGFSMGASTLGMYSGMEEATNDVDFLILDCPYDTMEDVVRVGIEAAGVPIPTEFAMWAGNTYNRVKSGFGYEEVRPIDSVAKSKVPMFIIHAKDDIICPVIMGKNLYVSKEEGYKEIWIVEGADHVRAFEEYPEAYNERVMDFIENATKSK